MSRLLRWLTDPQYRTVTRWYAEQQDDRLRFDYGLKSGDVVFDVGAYKGEYAVRIAKTEGVIVHAFEPVPVFARDLEQATASLANVQVHNFGLAASDVSATMTLDGLASSRNRSNEAAIRAQFRSIVDVMRELAPNGVKLMKMNIEGDEYDTLPALNAAGLLPRVGNLLVQFHLISRGDKRRYAETAAMLSRTHELAWRYPFVWESWRLRG